MSVSSEQFLEIQATTDCRFTLKRIRDMMRTNSHDSYRNVEKEIELIPQNNLYSPI